MKKRIAGTVFGSVALLAVLWHTFAVSAPSATGYPRLMQGPMLGPVEEDSAVIWARASGDFDFSVEYGLDPKLAQAQQSRAVRARTEEDHVAVVRLEGLQPDTHYYYRVLLNGKRDTYRSADPPHPFKTAPAKGSTAVFSMAFGSCARSQQDDVQRVWDVVRELNPAFFLWTGDNIYGDSLDPEILAEEYRRQREIASIRPMLATIPQLAIWDDHDYALNDHDRTNPVKEEALAVFKQHWPNPGYGKPGAPGVFFAWSYGGVDFFCLDGRYHRDPNDAPEGPAKTMLGRLQLEWLKEELAGSTAPFKVLVSGSGWTSAKGAGGDSWAAFLHERDALFEYIRTKEITGVVLISGDTHTGELNAIPWSEHGGYDYYDLVSSPLAQKASDGWRTRQPEVRLRPGFEKPNVGLITFDTTATPPTLTFNLYDEEGQPAWEALTLTTEDLKNGAATCKDKSRM